MEIICEECGKKFERRTAEVNRSLKKGRRQFCSRKCNGKNTPIITNRDKYPPSTKGLKSDNRKDEFSPFRPHMNRIKSRNHEVDLTLEDLKALWEEQEGVCPLTGWELEHVKVGRRAVAKTASLDRIDNSMGYLNGNVRWIANIANMCKQSWDDEEVIAFCKAVAKAH